MSANGNQVGPENANSPPAMSQQASIAESNRRFNFFELAPLAYFLFDFHHQLLDLNLMAAELLSLGRTQVLTKRFLTFVNRDDREKFHQHLSDVFSTGQPCSLELRLSCDLRGERWVQLHSQLLESEDGTRQCLTAAEDFTERKRALETLERNEAQLTAIYDSVPIMLCLVNDQMEVVRMNRAMTNLVGPLDLYQRSSSPSHEPCPGGVLGCVNSMRFHAPDKDVTTCERCSFRTAIMDTLATSTPHHQVEKAFVMSRDSQRTEMHVLTSTALVHIEGRRMVTVALEDITRRKQLEAQFLRSQRLEAVGELAGGVAHDFSNILSAILMNLDLLRQEEASPEIRSIVESLSSTAQHATSLNRQLLLFSRREILQARNLDVNETLNALMKMLRRLLRENIEIELSETVDSVWIHADPGMIEQAIVNLCVNAGDAMPGGGRLYLRTARVEITTQDAAVNEDGRLGEFVCLTVTDTGCGMDEATLTKIFEPFFTTKTGGKSSGLGLAAVFGIVKQHQGWISAASTPGTGTTFRIYLPAVEPDQAAPGLSSSRKHPTGTEGILIIEDDASVRSMVSLSLKRLGYRVNVARNATEALAMWDAIMNTVSLVMTDMVLPETMSGLELILKLRESNPKISGIVFSGYAVDPARQSATWPPDIGFIGKPFQLSELADVVRKCLDRAK